MTRRSNHPGSSDSRMESRRSERKAQRVQAKSDRLLFQRQQTQLRRQTERNRYLNAFKRAGIAFRTWWLQLAGLLTFVVRPIVGKSQPRQSIRRAKNADYTSHTPRMMASRASESLEDRCLLAVTTGFSTGTLTITLNAASDHAYVSYDGANYDVGTVEGASDIYNGTDAVTQVAVVDGGAFAGQIVTFSGSNAFPGTLTNLTATGIETSEVQQSILAATIVAGDSSVVNVAAPGTLPDGIDLAASGGTVNLVAGTFTHTGQLDINKPVWIIGAGQDQTIIKRSGQATGTEDRAVSINAANVTLQSLTLGGWDTVPSNANVGNGYLAWLNDVLGNNAVGDADGATFDDVRFDANDNRVAINVGTLDNLTVTDSHFTGTLFRAGIRGAGENMLISRNTFEESHYWYGPIYFEYGGATSGEISYNYFASRVGVSNDVHGDFKSDGTGLYAITNYQPNTITGVGLSIIHNTFHFQDSGLINDHGSQPKPIAVYNDPALTASGPITVRDNIFQGYEYTGAQPTSAPNWQPAARPAPDNGALSFDGIKSHGVFQSPFNIGSKGTISVWINPTDVGSVRHSVINGGGLEVTVRNGTVYFYPDSGETTATLTYAAANSFVANTWTHLALTWDFANKTTRIYINGTETVYQTGGGFGTGSSHPTWASAGNTLNKVMYIGRDPANPDRFFPGLIDEIGFFNDVLTPAEISSVMTNTVATFAGDPRLEADWNLDQAMGSVAVDAENSIDLHVSTTGLLPVTFTAPTFQPAGGQISGALEFDRTKENFGTFRSPSFDIGASGTVSLWIRPTDVGSTRYQILDGGGMGFTIRNGTTYFSTVSGNDNTLTYATNGAFVANTWTHLAYTWDSASKTTRIYINGVEASYQGGFGSLHPLWNTVSNTVDQLMTVGRDPANPNPDRAFPGRMDDVGIFNQALSLAEVNNIKNLGVATLVGDPRLVTHWDLDDASGTTVVPGDSGTGITLYLQQQPPLPGIQGYAINSSPNTTATNNLFYNNDVDFNVSVTDGGNFVGNPVFKLSDAVPEPFYQIGFGSLAAYSSTEYQLNDMTLSPHIGAYQGAPGLFGTGYLTVNGSDGDDLLELSMTGPDSGTLTYTRSFETGGVNEAFAQVILTQITGLTLNGGPGDDRLIIHNMNPGNVFDPVDGIIFNGGSIGQLTPGGNSAGDSLQILGGAAATVEHRYTNNSDGAVFYNGKTTATITYTGLEPIDDTIIASERIFTFTGGAKTITLIDNIASDGLMTIDSPLSETTSFANPTGSLTINAGTGDDIVNITSVDAGFNKDLTINGDAGNDTVNLNIDITFAAGENLNVDLANDADPGDMDAVFVGTNANLILSGSGTATLRASKNIALASGSSITTVNGGITLDANSTGLTAGNLIGLAADNATVQTTGTGNISLSGRGANNGNVDGNQYGVYLHSGTSVTSTAAGVSAGAISITGTGGNGTNSNYGVFLTGATTDVTSVDGAISITGTGNGSGINNLGVFIDAGVTLAVSTTGLATTNITGNGAGTAAGVSMDSPISSGTGFVTIQSTDDDITFGVAGDITSASGTVTINADTANSGIGSVFMADDTLIDAGSGLIDVDADVNVTLGGLMTLGEVQVTAAAGAIIDGGNAHVDIIASTAALRAVTGIGSADDLDTSISTLAAVNTTSGNIQIDNSVGGLLTIGTVNSLVGVTNGIPASPVNNGGSIWITNGSPITVSAPIIDALGGNITVAAEGNALTDDLTINANITATGGTGNINLFAGDTISTNTTAIISAVSTGQVALAAGTDYNDFPVTTNLNNGNAGGDILMGDGSQIRSDDGTIALLAPDDITLSIVNADFDTDATDGSVLVVADWAGVDGTFVDANGTIIDGLTDEGDNVIGGSAILSAEGDASNGIGNDAAAANDIDTTLSNLVAVTDTGDINIDNTGALTIGNGGGAAISITLAGTPFSTLAAFSLSGVTIQDSVNNDSTVDNISVTAVGTLTVDLNNAVVNNDGGNILLAAEGTANLLINEDVTVTGADATLDADGNVCLLAGGSITVDATVTISTNLAGEVTLAAGTDNNSGTLQNGDATGNITMGVGSSVTSGTGQIALLAPNDIAVSILNAGTGDILVWADWGGVGNTVAFANGTGAISDSLGTEAANLTGDDAILRAGSGIATDADDIDTTLNNVTAVTDSGDINLDNTQALVIGNGAGAGLSITLVGCLSPLSTSLAGITISDVVNDNSAADNITVTAVGALTVDTANPVVNNDGGNILLAAEGTATTDDLTIRANVTVTGGDSTLDADGNISLFAGGDILQTAGTISANSFGAVSLSAGENFAAGVNAAGFAAADVTMTSGVIISSGSGPISIEATRNVDLSIVTTTGNVTVSADDDDFSLANGTGAITDNLASEAANITANLATLDAATGIGSAGDIETNITTLDATNDGLTGDININEIAAGGDIDVNDLSQTNAGGSISLFTENGDMTVVAAQSGVTIAVSGSVTLDANTTAPGNEDVTPTGSVNINAVITTVGGNIFVNADHDIIAGAAGTVSTGAGGGNITLTADTNNSLQNIPSNRTFDGTIQFAAGADITAGTGNVTFSLTDCDGAINSRIVSSTNIVKNGSGALRLNGGVIGTANNFTGQTLVNAGFLLINGVLTDGSPGTGGDVVVASGAVLGGSGDAATTGLMNGGADVVVLSGGILDPGDVSTTDCSPLTGRLAVDGDVEFRTGSTFRVQLNSLVLGTGYDQLAVKASAGTVTIGDNVSYLDAVVGFSIPIGGRFEILVNDLADDIAPANTATFIDANNTGDELTEGDFFTSGGTSPTLFNVTYQASAVNSGAPYDGNTNDIVLTAPGRFDLNGVVFGPFYSNPTQSPTELNWTGVPEHTVKTTSNSYGWDKVIPSFDRVAPTSLLRDGHYAGSATFQVDVVANNAATPGEETYRVVLQVGDYSFRHDLSRIRVYDRAVYVSTTPSTYQEVTVTTEIGDFATVVFDNVTISQIGTSGLGELYIEFFDRGALGEGGDGNFVVNAIEIRPVSSVGILTLTRNDAALLATPQDADGLTVDTYNGTGAPPNSVITAATTNGTVTSADQDLNTDGVQVLANSSGNFSFTVQRPASTDDGVSTNIVAGSTISAGEVSGLSFGSVDQAYQVAALRRFDFNRGTLSPTATPGFIGVAGNNLWSSITGYGWTAVAGDTDRGSGSGTFTDLRRDMNYGVADNTFRFEVVPGASYSVRVYVGDYSLPRHDIRVNVEGTVYDIPYLAPGVFDLTVTAGNSVDSIMEVTFSYVGGNDIPIGWIVNAIDVSSATLPGEFAVQTDTTVSNVAGGDFSLTQSELAPLMTEALTRWQVAGQNPATLLAIANYNIRIVDLPAGVLSLVDTMSNSISVDIDADGLGWYLDADPGSDNEFFGGAPAPAGIDLLTVLTHEVGHLLELPAADPLTAPNSVMRETLPTQTRRLTYQMSATAEIDVTSGTTPVVDGSSTLNLGSTALSTPLQKGFVVKNTGLTPLTLGAISVPTGFSVVSGFGTSTLEPGQTTSFTLQLNASTAGNFSGPVSIVTNDSDENPFDFTVSGTVIAPPVIAIMDNGDAGFTSSGMDYFAGAGYFQNDVHYQAGGSGSAVATWTFTGLTPGMYRVSSTWLEHHNRATNVPYTVFNGVTSLGTVLINQELAPNDLVDAAVPWEYLGGIWTITSTTLVVQLTNNANEYVMADGVRIERVGDLVLAPEIVVLDGSSNIVDGSGSVNFGTTSATNPLQRTFTVQNQGGANLTLQPVSVPAGFSVVTNIAANTVVAPGGQVTFVVQLDAAANGSFSGQLSFVNDDADENPFNFTINGTVAAAPVIAIMDNGDAGFTSSNMDYYVGAGYFQNDVHYQAGGSGSAVATWTFTGLTPGMYRVSSTWLEHHNRATNVPYTVFNGVTSLGTVLINQELAPNDLVDAAVPWEYLGGIWTITSTTLAVRLTNAANEYVMADGVRIERLSPLLAAGGAIADSGGGTLTSQQLQPIVAEAITRLGHEGFDPQLLSRVVFTIEDLPGATLGVAGSQAISIDVNAAGYGWFVDATPFDDSEFADGTAPHSAMDLLSVVMHELGHTVGLVDLYDADHADDLMFGYLQPGTRRDAGEESGSETPAALQPVAGPGVSSLPVPVVADRVDLFAGSDAVLDVSRFVIVQQPVSRLSSLIAKLEDPDRRQGFGPMPESDNSDPDLSSAEIDELFLGLLDPANAFDLFS